MTTPPGLLTRLRTAEAELAALRSELARYASRSAVPPRAEPIVRLAVTCPTAADDYPAAAGCFPASVFPIKFLDVDFTETAGDQALTDTVRSGAAQAVAYSLHDRYLAEGTPVRVLRQNRRWVILDEEAVALVAASAALASGDFTAGVGYPAVSGKFYNDQNENYFEWDAANNRLEATARGAGVWLFRWRFTAQWTHDALNTYISLPAAPNGTYQITVVDATCTPDYVIAGDATNLFGWAQRPTLVGFSGGGAYATQGADWLFRFGEGGSLKLKVTNNDTGGTLTTSLGALTAIRTTYNDWLPT